jgi:hypothetical protein
MFLLKKNFALSIAKCAELVSLLPNALSEERLFSLYKKASIWKAWRAWLDQGGDFFRINTLEGKKDLVALFPYDSLPLKLKPHHPEHRS